MARSPLWEKLMERSPTLRRILERTPAGRKVLDSPSVSAPEITTTAPTSTPAPPSKPKPSPPPSFTETDFYKQDWSSPTWKPHPDSQPGVFDVRNYRPVLHTEKVIDGKKYELYKLYSPDVWGSGYTTRFKVDGKWEFIPGIDAGEKVLKGLSTNLPYGQDVHSTNWKKEKSAVEKWKKDWQRYGFKTVTEIRKNSDGTYSYRLRVFQPEDVPSDIPTRIADVDPDAAKYIPPATLTVSPEIMDKYSTDPVKRIEAIQSTGSNRLAGMPKDTGVTGGTGLPSEMPHTFEGAMTQALREQDMGLLDERKPSGQTFDNTGFASQTYIPAKNVFERASEIQSSQPAYQRFVKWSEMRAKEMEEQKFESDLMRDRVVGFDPETGKEITAKISPYLKKFGFKPGDPDYQTEITKIDEQIELQTKGITDIRTNINLSKELLPEAKTNLRKIQQSPAGSQFYIDEDKDGQWDVNSSGNPITVSREKLLQQYPKIINQLERNISYEGSIPEYEADLTSLTRLKDLLEGYEELGYEMDYTEKEGYEFYPPKATKVYDWYYGTEWHSAIPKVGAGWMEGFWIPSAAAAIQSGIDPKSGAWEAKQEELAETGLGYAFDINVKHDPGAYWGKIATSDAMITIGTFAATAGLGYAATGAGKVLGAKGAGFFGKISNIGSKFTPTGAKILSGGAKAAKTLGKPLITIGRPVMRLAGTKVGRFAVGATMFGALEGPGLYKTATERPEMFGSEVSKAGMRWIVPYAGFKVGSKMYTKTHQFKPPTTGKETQHMAVKMDMFTEPIDVDFSDLTILTPDEQAPGVLTGKEIRGIGEAAIKEAPVKTFGFKTPKYQISFKGTSFTPTSNMQIFGYDQTDDALRYLGSYEKGKTYAMGKGVVSVEWRTPDLKLHSRSMPFDWASKGEKLYVSTATEGGKEAQKILFKSGGAAQLKSTGQITKMGGVGILEPGYEGTFQYKDFMKLSSGDLKLVTFAGESDLTKSVFYGKYTPLQPGYKEGIMFQSTNIHDIKKMDALLTISKRPGLASTKTASMAMPGIKPSDQITYNLMSVGFGQQVASLSGQVPAVVATPVGSTASRIGAVSAPSLIAGLGSLGANIGSQKYKYESVKIGALEKPLSVTGIGNLGFADPSGEQKQKLENLSANINLSDIEQKQKLGTGLEDVYGFGSLGGTKIITETEDKLEQIPGIDLGNIGLTDQSQTLGLKTGQVQLTKLAQTPLVTTVSISPIVQPPVPPMFPTPIPWFGTPDKKTKIKKKRKKKKVKRKPKFIIEKMHKGLLADPLSVARSQARYGTATHPEVNKKLWKIGERTAFTRVPTLEMLKSKKRKKGKKKKRDKKDVLF